MRATTHTPALAVNKQGALLALVLAMVALVMALVAQVVALVALVVALLGTPIVS